MIFMSKFMKDIGLLFYFCTIFAWLWYQGNAGQTKPTEMYFFSPIFWKRLYRLGVNVLSIWWNFPVKSS